MKKIYLILSLFCVTFLIAACTNDVEEAKIGQGYLKVNVETNQSTITRASNPSSDYVPTKLHVEVQDAQGDVAKSAKGELLSTNDFANSDLFKGNIKLDEGTYTIIAHSANWDGSNSAFNAPYYSGSTTITIEPKTAKEASITCRLANVKVTVNYDDNFKKYFESAKTVVTSALADVTSRTFEMNQPTGSAYFPEADLTLKVTVNNDASKSMETTITDVKARDHYIINYTVAQPTGTQGSIRVFYDDSQQTYNYTIEVPRKSMNNLEVKAANAWSIFADLKGEVSLEKEDYQNVTLQWKKQTDLNWTTVANNALTNNKGVFTYRLKGLTASTAYVYRLVYDNGADDAINSNEVRFTTESQPAIYNGGFEDWNKSGKAWYPNESGVSYWDTSNPGSTAISESDNVTTRTKNPVHSGTYAAKLQTKYILIKLAAASIYTGRFVDLVGTDGAKLNWGVPFTGRPTSLRGYMRYNAGAIDHEGSNVPSGAPAKGQPDKCQIRIALLTSTIQVDNSSAAKIASTFPNWDTDERVIAYGEMSQNTTDTDWRQFNIDFVYHKTDVKPSYLLVVCSSSMYGDYYHGSESSVLYLDDFELIYGDNPLAE